MKKRILGLLMALCLIVGLLPMTALAASESATLSYATHGDFNTAPVSVTVKAGETKYFLTEKGSDSDWPEVSYVTPDGASADNYHIKLDCTGDVPTLYLKDAVVTSDFGLKLACANGAKLVVETDSLLGKTNSDAYRDHCIYFDTTGDVTITGAGTLTIHGSGRANYSDGYILTNGNLLIQDANIDLIEAPRYGETQVYYAASAIMAEGGNITIDHSNIYADYNGSRKSVTNLFKATYVDGKGGNITVKNRSEIVIWSAGYTSGGCAAFSIHKDEDLTDDKTWLVTFENSNVEVGMCYHAAAAYAVFNVPAEQISIKDTDEAIIMLPDTAAGELWCEDMRTYFPEYEDEEEPMYSPLTIAYIPDEFNEPVKTVVQATLENGALKMYDDVDSEKIATLKYFKLTHVCIAEGDVAPNTTATCVSCGATFTTPAPEDDSSEGGDDEWFDDELDTPTLPQSAKPGTDDTEKEGTANVVLYVVVPVVAVAVIAVVVVLVVLKKKNTGKDEKDVAAEE